MMPINHIPTEERQAIENWIACHGEARHTGIVLDPEAREDFDTIFECWNEAKKPLWELMGKQITLSKYVEITLSDKVMRHRIERQLMHHKFIAESYWQAMVYQFAYTDKGIMLPDNLSQNMRDLVNAEHLFSNEWDRDTFSIPTLDGKEIKVEKGTKIIRVLGKIAKAFSLSDFEEFRIIHSQILNDRVIRGDLCLSIHPLDFLTMSDNDLNWSSCMRFAYKSFGNNNMHYAPGCYRVGTVEMMNSPYIIEAYIRNTTPMKMPDNSTWNNKKWRTLIFVDRNFITSIKSYPYQSSGLSRAAVNWVRELAEQNRGWTYEGDNAIAWQYEQNIETQSGATVQISMVTDKMYNDFGECTWHYGFVKSGLVPYECRHWEYNYSGVRTCLWCGKREYGSDISNDELYNDFVICRDCSGATVCSGCETHIPESTAEHILGRAYCPNCFKERTVVDIITQVRRDSYEFTAYYLIPDTVTKPEDIDTWRDYPHIQTHALSYGYRTQYAEQIAKYFINEPRQNRITAWCSTPIYFYHKDCTPEGIALFTENQVADD